MAGNQLTLQLLMDMAFSEMSFSVFLKARVLNWETIYIVVVLKDIIHRLYKLHKIEQKNNNSLWCQCYNLGHGVSTQTTQVCSLMGWEQQENVNLFTGQSESARNSSSRNDEVTSWHNFYSPELSTATLHFSHYQRRKLWWKYYRKWS